MQTLHFSPITLRSKIYASNQLFDFKEVFFGEGKKSVRILLKKIADHFTEGEMPPSVSE